MSDDYNPQYVPLPKSEISFSVPNSSSIKIGNTIVLASNKTESPVAGGFKYKKTSASAASGGGSGTSFPWLSYSATAPYTIDLNAIANININDTAGHQGTVNSTGFYFGNGSNYINATVAGLGGKSASWKLMNVCSNGQTKQMYVLGSDPF